MIWKLIELIVLLPLLSFYLSAQSTEFAPIGAEWIFDYELDDEIGYQRITVEGDTFIHNKLTKKLIWEKIFIDTSSFVKDTIILEEGYRFIHQQGDSIFYYNSNRDEFQLLLRFNVEVGDTILVPATERFFIPPDETIFISLVIDSISTISVDNANKLKVLHCRSDCINITDVFVPKVNIIEKIGPTSFLFFNEIYCDFSIPDWSLRCYSDEALNINFQEGEYPCDFITSIKVITNNKILFKLYPNPASKILFVEFQTDAEVFFIDILDIYGRTIWNGIMTSTVKRINVSDFMNNMYFLRIMDSLGNTMTIKQFSVVK